MRSSPPLLRAISLFAALLPAASPTFAQTTATTDPVGFVTLACPAGSDTTVGLPLTRPAEFTGSVLSVSNDVVTVAGTPGWATNSFVRVAGTQPKTFFALIGTHATTNPKEGRAYTVTANTSNTLTLNLNGDSISNVASDTQIVLIPYWTLASVFPATDANISFTPSPNAGSLETQILIPDYTNSGINLAPVTNYFFFNGAWRQLGQLLTEDHGDDLLAIRDYFIVRNKSAATQLTSQGGVLMKKLTIPLSTEIAAQQDNFVAVARPLDVMLKDLGLISSGAFEASPDAGDIRDQLLVTDSSLPGINKAPTTNYFYCNGAWRKLGQLLTDDYGTDVIKAGAGFVIRKAPTANGGTAFWTNTKTY